MGEHKIRPFYFSAGILGFVLGGLLLALAFYGIEYVFTIGAGYIFQFNGQAFFFDNREWYAVCALVLAAFGILWRAR